MKEIEKQILVKQYEKENKSINQLSKLYGCSRHFIRKKLLEFNVKLKIRKNLGKVEIGIKYNSKLVLEYKDGKYRCVCDCGEKLLLNRADLLSPKNLGFCKFCRHKRGNLSSAWRGLHELTGAMWSSIKTGARRRNIKFNISIEYALSIFREQNGICVYTGQKLTLPIKQLLNKTASLDRIDSKIGYIEGNVQWIHKDINYMKQDLSEKRFLFLCENIANFDRILKPNKELENLLGIYFSKVKCSARSVNRIFEITKEDIDYLYMKQGNQCALSGLPLHYEKLYKDLYKSTASVDRIDSTKGYLKDNIQLVLKDVNRMKQDFTDIEFIEMCRVITKYKK